MMGSHTRDPILDMRGRVLTTQPDVASENASDINIPETSAENDLKVMDSGVPLPPETDMAGLTLSHNVDLRGEVFTTRPDVTSENDSDGNTAEIPVNHSLSFRPGVRLGGVETGGLKDRGEHCVLLRETGARENLYMQRTKKNKLKMMELSCSYPLSAVFTKHNYTDIEGNYLCTLRNEEIGKYVVVDLNKGLEEVVLKGLDESESLAETDTDTDKDTDTDSDKDTDRDLHKAKNRTGEPAVEVSKELNAPSGRSALSEPLPCSLFHCRGRDSVRFSLCPVLQQCKYLGYDRDGSVGLVSKDVSYEIYPVPHSWRARDDSHVHSGDHLLSM